MKIITSLFSLLFVWFICPGAFAQEDSSDGNDTLPPFTLDKLLNAPSTENPSWEMMEGKVVVLEFWATWCAPCILQIPHINEMVAHFKDQPIQFISISGEEESVVTEFLKKRPIDGWVGVDADGSMFEAFGQPGLPGIVVIDRSGSIVVRTHPVRLETQHLEKILAGESVGKRLLNPPRFDAVKDSEEVAEGPLYQVLIEPTDNAPGGGMSSGDRISVNGVSLSDVLHLVYRTSKTRLSVQGVLPDGRYNFKVKSPVDDGEQTVRLLRNAIECSFGLVSHKESIEKDVYVLRTKDLNQENIKPTAITGKGSGWSMGNGDLQAVGMTLAQFGEALESFLERPVIDETELAGKYDITLPMKSVGISPREPAPGQLLDSIRNHLGFEVLSTRRNIEMLVVECPLKEDADMVHE